MDDVFSILGMVVVIAIIIGSFYGTICNSISIEKIERRLEAHINGY